VTDQPEECEFCAVARGEDTSVEVVCKSPEWVAFFPETPATPGHTLVIPRTHVSDFLDLDPQLASSVMHGVVRVSRAIKEALQPDGMNLISSAGEAASQTVFHLHLHLVPRRVGDDFGDIWPPKRSLSEAVEEALADRIRQACDEF
jgi:diadenosine tetraphosphate (Ap4A) HIT family hydrolase